MIYIFSSIIQNSNLFMNVSEFTVKQCLVRGLPELVHVLSGVKQLPTIILISQLYALGSHPLLYNIFRDWEPTDHFLSKVPTFAFLL